MWLAGARALAVAPLNLVSLVVPLRLAETTWVLRPLSPLPLLLRDHDHRNLIFLLLLATPYVHALDL